MNLIRRLLYRLGFGRPGLGGLPSPYDARDWSISQLYAARQIEAVTAPADYIVPGYLPPHSDQGNTPQCVAHSTGGMKGYEDRIDQRQFFPWDFGLFFRQIGGSSNGAYIRDAFKRLLSFGYPVVKVGDAEHHKVAAYYSVPTRIGDIQQALMAFGPVVLGVMWQNSWFRPVNGILPKPDGNAGGHAILCVGWRTINGKVHLHLHNSWNTTWGDGGDCYLSQDYIDEVFEAWKAVDQVITTGTGETMFTIIPGSTKTIGTLTLNGTHQVMRSDNQQAVGSYPRDTVWPVYGGPFPITVMVNGQPQVVEHWLVQPADQDVPCYEGVGGGDFTPGGSFSEVDVIWTVGQPTASVTTK